MEPLFVYYKKSSIKLLPRRGGSGLIYFKHIWGRRGLKKEKEGGLCVWISKDLTWYKQVNEQSSRANKLLGYLKRNTRIILRTEVRRTLYLALVRPHLGYATQIWAPQSIELIVKLERIQRRATKFILKLPYSSNISYKPRLQTLNLIPICY